MKGLQGLAQELLVFATVALMALAPFWLAGCEPWRSVW
jgi:hypothetical protein